MADEFDPNAALFGGDEPEISEEEAWWSIPQPILGGRTPDDAIREEMRRYGLDE